MIETSKISKKQIKTNIILSISVQIISLSVSFLLNMIVPKFISETQYAHWQTFVLYIGYVGIFHFGLLDGIVLRYSQYDYENIDKGTIRSQFKILLVINSIITLIISLCSLLFTSNELRILIILIAMAITSKNIFTYSSYSFQITNRIKKYAILIIVQRLINGIGVVVLLLCKVDNFIWYCVSELLGDLIGIIIAYLMNKDMYFGKSISFKESINECKKNVKSGFILMLANWSSLLIVSSAKMIIQWRWDNYVFGKISFAFSLTSLFLTFVSAISVVLFPSLKRMEKDSLPKIYLEIRNILSPLLLVALLCYFPGSIILNYWIPKYSVSLEYLAVLLPLIVYSAKVMLLTNNYLKAYRKEKKMMVINLVSAGLGIFIFIIGAYVINSLTVVLYSIVLIILFNSILSEIIVMRLIKVSIIKDIILEIVVIIGFYLALLLDNSLYSFLTYLGVVLIYFILNFNKIKNAIKSKI